jgi:hypothetical protein
VTDPLPVPELPAVMVSHGALLDAVQPHPAPAVTGTLPVNPAEEMLAVIGEIEVEHALPAWLTVKVLPPIVIVPVRGVVPAFGDTTYVTEPLPVPDAPPLIVIQESLLAAVHEQSAPTLTGTTPVNPVDPRFAEAAEMVGIQGAPACVTVNALPPIVIVPVRALPAAFAATT